MTGGLVIRDLAVPFGDEPGLHGISLEVRRGDRLAVVGRSGAGKTTLLRALAGLAPISHGIMTVDGREVTSHPPERRGAVYLHQTPILFPHLTVAENVAFPLRIRGRPEAELRDRVARLLNAVGLEELGGRAPRTLSGGQRSRAALARAVAAEPSLLLLDEPLSALDPSLREEVRAALLTLQAEYAPALIAVTHDLDEASLLANRIAVLLDGSFAQLAPAAELFRRPASVAVARFLGIANEIRGRLSPDGQFESPLGPIPIPGAQLGVGRALAFFQPDAVTLTLAPEGKARVVEVRYRVHSTTVVAIQDGVAVEARSAQATPLAAGDPVCISIDPDGLILFSE